MALSRSLSIPSQRIKVGLTQLLSFDKDLRQNRLGPGVSLLRLLLGQAEVAEPRYLAEAAPIGGGLYGGLCNVSAASITARLAITLPTTNIQD